MTGDEFFEILGQVLAYGLGTAGVLFLLFKKMVETWIEKVFARREREFEHDRAVEMQRLRVRIDTAIQGAIRLQEREFKLLPEAWEHVSEAFGLARWLCSPMQQMGSISALSDSELEEFLAKSELRESQKDKIRAADERYRDELWWEMDLWQRYTKVKAAVSEADKFVKVNGVFLPDALRKSANDLVEVIWEAMIDYETGSQVRPKDYKMIRQGWDRLQGKGAELHASLEEGVRARLREQTQLSMVGKE